jgi:hypothetical protein
MSRNALLILLAGTALALSTATPARSQTPPPPVASGTYDSFGRDKGPDNRLPPNLDRVIKIERLSLGGLRFSLFDRNGNPRGSTVLVPKCGVTYDGRLASYFQTFQTTPGPGTPVEKVTFVFRINDPIGDYDVYFQQGNGPLRSEVIKRR